MDIKDLSDRFGDWLDNKQVKLGIFEFTNRDWILGVPAMALMGYAIIKVLANETINQFESKLLTPAALAYIAMVCISEIQKLISKK